MIDLRSDTVTVPTSQMRRAMAEAEVGDDVFREDPTVIRLQEEAAAVFEKEAAIFVPTGTMGNQVAVKIHTQPGQEVILEERGHIYNWEMATMSAFSGCLARPIRAQRGILRWVEIESALSPPLYYRAPTGLIALENTHNMAGGTIMTAAETAEICGRAHDAGLPVHLDGARIFNAAAALETSVAELSRHCDSVMFCLSKGLAAPVGSLLVGSQGFIDEAWSVRKMMGGGMRQVGVLAAAGLIALREMPSRLAEDHKNARLLAQALIQLEGFSVELESVQTNIVIVDLSSKSSAEVVELLATQGILAVATGSQQIRLVTHKDISRSNIREVIDTCQKIFR